MNVADWSRATLSQDRPVQARVRGRYGATVVERGVLGATSAAVCEAGEVEGDVMTSVLVERGRERERRARSRPPRDYGLWGSGVLSDGR